MGVCYTAINHTKKTYYELGKRLSFWQIDEWPATEKQIHDAVFDTVSPEQHQIGLALRIVKDLVEMQVEEIYNDTRDDVDEDYMCLGSVYTCNRADKAGLTWRQNHGE